MQYKNRKVVIEETPFGVSIEASSSSSSRPDETVDLEARKTAIIQWGAEQLTKILHPETLSSDERIADTEGGSLAQELLGFIKFMEGMKEMRNSREEEGSD